LNQAPKWLCALHKLGEIMNEDARKSARTNGIRWIQHKLLAAKILLQEFATSLASITDDSKVPSYVNPMKLMHTIAHLHLFVDLLSPISKLSEHLHSLLLRVLL
jgi:hypothetical protein